MSGDVGNRTPVLPSGARVYAHERASPLAGIEPAFTPVRGFPHLAVPCLARTCLTPPCLALPCLALDLHPKGCQRISLRLLPPGIGRA